MRNGWIRITVTITDSKHSLAKKLLEKSHGRPLSQVVQSIVEKFLKEDGRRRNIITVEELITDDVFLLSNEEIFEVLSRLQKAENALIEELSRRLGNAQKGREQQAVSLRGGGEV